MDAGQFVVSTGCAVDKPRSPHAYFPGRMPGKRGSGVLFLFGYFLFTPGILPSALRASFAVRMRILRMREHAKRK